MLGLINTLTPSHIIESEAESGGGRADIVLIPHNGKGDQAIIIEYKISKKKEDLALMAKTGLEQIIDKRYDLKIKQHPHVKKILKIGMAFFGKNVEMVYVQDKNIKQLGLL